MRSQAVSFRALATKPAAKKSAPAAKKTDALTQLPGVGPAMAKRLNEAGITSLNQLANPDEKDKKALESFSSMKSYSDWVSKAKELVK